MDQTKQCDHMCCEDMATFAIFAVGYPAAMYIACDQHIGALLRWDMSAPGSMEAWTVRPRQMARS